MTSRKRKTNIVAPSLKTRIITFSEELSKWKQEGYPIVTNERYSRRLQCCERCEFFKNLAIGGMCLKCGCYSVKLWLETSKCPINKW